MADQVPSNRAALQSEVAPGKPAPSQGNLWDMLYDIVIQPWRIP